MFFFKFLNISRNLLLGCFTARFWRKTYFFIDFHAKVQFFDKTFEVIGQHPEAFGLLDQADLLEDIVGTIAKRFLPVFRLFPVFSNEAMNVVPYLREPLFTALYELQEIEHHKLTLLTERIMRRFYEYEVRPNLVETLKDNVKGRSLLLPLIDEAVNHLPADRCMTSLISILCTPKNELSQGRIISIVLQELGQIADKLGINLYIKPQ
jgi:hypothetical protein